MGERRERRADEGNVGLQQGHRRGGSRDRQKSMREGGVQRGLRQGKKGEGALRDETGTVPGLLSVSQAAEKSPLCPQEIAFCLSFSNIKVYF